MPTVEVLLTFLSLPTLEMVKSISEMGAPTVNKGFQNTRMAGAGIPHIQNLTFVRDEEGKACSWAQ
jgi:hypothetical protein